MGWRDGRVLFLDCGVCKQLLLDHAFAVLCLGSKRGRIAMNIPALNEILEILTPLDLILLLILQLRNILAHDISQQVYQACLRLHLSPIGWKREAMLRYF